MTAMATMTITTTMIRVLAMLALALAVPHTAVLAAAGEQARSEVSLGSRAVSLTYDASLRADEPAQAALLSGGSTARVKVGAVTTTAGVRIGALNIDPTEAPRDLWLTRIGASWELQTDSGATPLAHRSLPSKAPTLAASLQPVTDTTGRLILLLGEHEWSTDLQVSGTFRRRISVSGNRTPETDTRPAARVATLAERNETAWVTPGGARVTVQFWRNLEATAKKGFDAIDRTKDGDVLLLTHGAVMRLESEVPLKFGDALLPTNNLAPNSPGIYALWLRRTGASWRLVFNREPDAWGSQHDAAFDVAGVTVDLAHETAADASRPLSVSLQPLGIDRCRLILSWGPHTWSTELTLAPRS